LVVFFTTSSYLFGVVPALLVAISQLRCLGRIRINVAWQNDSFELDNIEGTELFVGARSREWRLTMSAGNFCDRTFIIVACCRWVDLQQTIVPIKHTRHIAAPGGNVLSAKTPNSVS
jgi:hypothetical protein